jgi:hypothetical protein
METTTCSEQEVSAENIGSLVECWRSVTGSATKLHVEVNCAGLRWVPVHPAEKCGIEPIYFEDWFAFAAAEQLPCRICALEPMLSKVLSQKHENGVFATFASQPSAEADQTRFSEKRTSQSGRERFVRLTERLGLPNIDTRRGPATYGKFSAPQIFAVAKNLCTEVLPDADHDAEGEHLNEILSIFWSLTTEDGSSPSTNWMMAKAMS